MRYLTNCIGVMNSRRTMPGYIWYLHSFVWYKMFSVTDSRGEMVLFSIKGYQAYMMTPDEFINCFGFSERVETE